jgi:hypothetical protein
MLAPDTHALAVKAALSLLATDDAVSALYEAVNFGPEFTEDSEHVAFAALDHAKDLIEIAMDRFEATGYVAPEDFLA